MFCKNGGCAGIFLKLKETVSLLLFELNQIKNNIFNRFSYVNSNRKSYLIIFHKLFEKIANICFAKKAPGY
jgi:hypothetical protein